MGIRRARKPLLVSAFLAASAVLVVASWGQPASQPASGPATGAPAGCEDIAYSLLKNGSFEDALAGWELSKGWGKMDQATAQQALSIRTDGAKAGRSYLRVANKEKSGFYGIQQPVKFEANTVYKLSWWSRGKGKRGQEQGANRLRLWGYGGPEYTGDTAYGTDQWTYHEYVFYATQGGAGGVSVWVWPGEYCDLDDVMLRKAFWRSDKPFLRLGDSAQFRFDMPGAKPEPVKVECRLLASDGTLIKTESFEGATPLTRTVDFRPEKVGYYRLQSVARTASAEFTDTLGLAVTSPVEGMEAVRQEWAK